MEPRRTAKGETGTWPGSPSTGPTHARLCGAQGRGPPPSDREQTLALHRDNCSTPAPAPAPAPGLLPDWRD